MKNSRFITLAFLFLFMISFYEGFAITPSQAEAYKEEISSTKSASGLVPTAPLSHKQLKKQKRLAKWQKRWQKLTKKINALLPAVDFTDPVEKWMWFWIFGWGAAIVLYLIASAIATGSVYGGNGAGFGFAGLLALLVTLASIAGTVALVIWLLKLSGV